MLQGHEGRENCSGAGAELCPTDDQFIWSVNSKRGDEGDTMLTVDGELGGVCGVVGSGSSQAHFGGKGRESSSCLA